MVTPIKYHGLTGCCTGYHVHHIGGYYGVSTANTQKEFDERFLICGTFYGVLVAVTNDGQKKTREWLAGQGWEEVKVDQRISTHSIAATKLNNYLAEAKARINTEKRRVAKLTAEKKAALEAERKAMAPKPRFAKNVPALELPIVRQKDIMGVINKAIGHDVDKYEPLDNLPLTRITKLGIKDVLEEAYSVTLPDVLMNNRWKNPFDLSIDGVWLFNSIKTQIANKKKIPVV